MRLQIRRSQLACAKNRPLLSLKNRQAPINFFAWFFLTPLSTLSFLGVNVDSMADIAEKGSAYNSGSSDDGSQNQVALYERPPGLKGFYYHPVTQVVMLGFVCFMGPGTSQHSPPYISR